jgi:hypothetical protein
MFGGYLPLKGRVFFGLCHASFETVLSAGGAEFSVTLEKG